MNGLTRNLAEFVASLEFKKIPADAVATVKRGFIDCIGVMFAGRDEPVVKLLLNEIVFFSENIGNPEQNLYDILIPDNLPSGLYTVVAGKGNSIFREKLIVR